MARTPDNPIFQGISAIEAAGGIDGFVREVLAEAQRLSLQTIRQRTVPMGDDRCEELLYTTMTDVMFRRLEPDIERGFAERAVKAIESCERDDQVQAASERALAEAENWSRELVKATQEELFGMHLLDK